MPDRRDHPRAGRPGLPAHGPLASLVEMLEAVHLVPLDRLPSAIDAAAEALGLRVVIYLVDYAGIELVPFPGAHGGTRQALDLYTTTAGEAFRSMNRLASTDTTSEPTVWVPVVDGVERVGVLEVMVDEGRLGTPELDEELWWFAHCLGHVITAFTPLGDAVDQVRRRRPRTVAAELVWQLLPPLTGGTDRVLISGLIEPTEDVGGDVFDYALAQEVAAFAVFDATGHDLGAGLVAATALAAYRNARRAGRSLSAQAEAVDEAISTQFARETFATGVVAELELSTGRLAYVAAGHPYPLLVRGGRVVGELTGGRRTIFGLRGSQVEVGEEQLEPDDVVVLYTDGVTEARDADRHPFGVEGLSRFLESELAAEVSLPEVARRLGRSIVDRQDGVLADDSTILLAQWTTEGQSRLDPPPLRG